MNRIERGPNKPSDARSDGNSAKPARIPCAGVRKRRGGPNSSKRTVPPSAARSPKIVRSSVERPEPAAPHNPNTSPRATSNDTPRKASPLRKPSTRNAGGAPAPETEPPRQPETETDPGTGTETETGAAPPNIASTIRSPRASEPSSLAATRPSRNTVTRSARPANSSIRCVTCTTAAPRSRKPRNRANNRSVSEGGRIAVGSSRISTRGRQPPDSPPPPSSPPSHPENAPAISSNRRCSRPSAPAGRSGSNRSSPTVRSASRARSRVRSRSSNPKRLGGRPPNRFSASDQASTILDSCDTSRTPAVHASRGDRGEYRSPPSTINPRPGRVSPHKIRASVVLPAPFAPTSAWISPALASKSTSINTGAQ